MNPCLKNDGHVLGSFVPARLNWLILTWIIIKNKAREYSVPPVSMFHTLTLDSFVYTAQFTSLQLIGSATFRLVYSNNWSARHCETDHFIESHLNEQDILSIYRCFVSDLLTFYSVTLRNVVVHFDINLYVNTENPSLITKLLLFPKWKFDHSSY